MSCARAITSFTSSDIKSFFACARRLSAGSGALILARPRTQPHARILIVTSRKVGNAVVRNTIRRRIRSIFYTNKLFLSPCDFAFIARPGAAQLTSEDLSNLLLHAHAKALTIYQ